MQGVAAGVRLQAVHGARGQVHAAGLGQRAQLVERERVQDDLAAVARGRLHEALGQGRGVAGRDHDQHAVGDQPPDHEQQRPQRHRVGPVGVVDHHRDRVLVVERAEQLEQLRARRHVVAVERGALAGAPEELLEDAERQVALGLVAAGAQHREIVDRREEALDQRGLADARDALDEHDARAPGADVSSSFSSAPSSRRRPTKTASGAAPTCGCVAMALADSTPMRSWLRMGIPLSRMPCHAAYGPP